MIRVLVSRDSRVAIWSYKMATAMMDVTIRIRLIARVVLKIT